ncbi:hypothetical protein SAMN05660443_1666 [Marinospirillum celere]|uniref:Uncharacterized protein n=1 Tax=Marinospirillum celere TaxID=1122252 RepID=A0A1I1GWE8_9GAMM|nr:hypothetical protein [Marinospirillum celere]SFC15881.1 hypothetical protein SAMN05660443_1666 [Marinospirillum celere]
MIWHLIAAVFAGLAAAGVALLLRKLSGQRLPKWIIPVFAGLGMLGYQINIEYGWFEHKQTQLPSEARVVSSETQENFWRPWTLVVPMTSAFTVLDESSIRQSELNGERVTEFMLYRFQKQHVDQVRSQPFVLNCDNRELVPMKAERELQLDDLRRLSSSDPLYLAICENSSGS